MRSARRPPAEIQMEEDMQWLENEAKEGWQGLVDLEEWTMTQALKRYQNSLQTSSYGLGGGGTQIAG